MKKQNNIYPLVPLRDIVLFPRMIAPLFIGRAKSIKAIEQINKDQNYIVLTTQKDSGQEAPRAKDLFSIGVMAKIIQTLKLPDGTLKVLIETIKKDQIFIERFRASASRSRQALSREKQIQKIEMPEIKSTSRIAPNFVFKQEIKSGKEALVIDSLSKSFAERIIFNNVSVSIERGEKIAILGKNGIGKSTFLKTMLNIISAEKGTVSFGHNAKYAYFSQPLLCREEIKSVLQKLPYISVFSLF